jgi:hypothetical protein
MYLVLQTALSHALQAMPNAVRHGSYTLKYAAKAAVGSKANIAPTRVSLVKTGFARRH